MAFDCASGLVSDALLPLDQVGLEPIAWEARRPEPHHSANLEGQHVCSRLAGALTQVHCEKAETLRQMRQVRRMRHCEHCVRSAIRKGTLLERAPVQEATSAAVHKMPSLCTACAPCVSTAKASRAMGETFRQQAIRESSVSDSPLACAVFFQADMLDLCVRCAIREERWDKCRVCVRCAICVSCAECNEMHQ